MNLKLWMLKHPLFILYTSGSTGKPKGVLHTTGGYLVYAAFTHEYIFNYSQNDIYWCTADVGWVTATHILFMVLWQMELAQSYLKVFQIILIFSRHWKIVDKYKVNIYYTAPTLIRSLTAQGDQFVHKYSRKVFKTFRVVWVNLLTRLGMVP
ncbi:MAG: AMP-binding protein [Bacteriovoracaceae bacterium]